MERPTEWLRENRPITSDPAAIQALAHDQRRGRSDDQSDHDRTETRQL